MTLKLIQWLNDMGSFESGLTTIVQSETIPMGEVTSGRIWNRRRGNLVTLHPGLWTEKKNICTSLKKDKKKKMKTWEAWLHIGIESSPLLAIGINQLQSLMNW